MSRTTNHRLRLLVSLVSIALLSACVSTPNVSTPLEEAAFGAEQEGWLETVSGTSLEEGRVVTGPWWQSFEDATLDALLEAALTDSYDIRKSQARWREAQAVTQQVGSLQWPVVNASGGYTWTEQSVNSPNGPSSLIQAGFIDRELEFWGSSLSAQWDVDLFGGNRFATRSAVSRQEASRAALRGVRLATVAQVASAYVNHVALKRRLAILQENVRAQEESLELLSRRLGIGLESRLNVDRAAGQLAANQSGVPLLEARLRQSVHQLAVLTGLEFSVTDALLEKAKPLQGDNARPAMGAKSELLTRRPDIQVAQFQLLSASADVGTAKSDLLPKLVLGATSGFESGSPQSLFEGASRLSALAPTVSFPVFNRGRLKAASEAAQARFDFALSHFEQTVAQAFTDAESRLLDHQASFASAERLQESARRNREAAERAEKLYDRGLVSYLELLDARRQKLSAEDAAVAAQANRDVALVQLYIALGGGWQTSQSGVAGNP